MTTAQLHVGVNLGVQKVASNVRDDFLSQEVDYYLNESVKDYIKQQYSAIKAEDRNIEGQYVNENLRTLITTAELDNSSVVDYLPNTVENSLPNDYLYYIFSRTKNDNQWFSNRKLEPKAIKDYVESESNSPQFREFPILIQNNKVLVIGDAVNVLSANTEVVLTYIKEPNEIDFVERPNEQLTLPLHTHTEIVNLAVDKLLTVIQGRREQ